MFEIERLENHKRYLGKVEVPEGSYKVIQILSQCKKKFPDHEQFDLVVSGGGIFITGKEKASPPKKDPELEEFLKLFSIYSSDLHKVLSLEEALQQAEAAEAKSSAEFIACIKALKKARDLSNEDLKKILVQKIKKSHSQVVWASKSEMIKRIINNIFKKAQEETHD